MKKGLFVLAVLLFAVVTATACGASETAAEAVTLTLQIDNPVMTVNGEAQSIDGEGTAPVLRDGRTLVPVRAVVEAMGGRVGWDAATRTATLTCGGDSVALTIDSTAATFNGEARTLDVAPILLGGRTMFPIRFIAECFGFTVGWNAATRTATITKPSTAEESPEVQPEERGKILVVYYSATGSTERAAKLIAEAMGADLFALEPVEPYTSADLNWNDENSRVVREHNDESQRQVALKTVRVPDFASYDTVLLGYPIWWGIAAWPVDGFVAANDFTGKTVVPFCTSASSGLGDSGQRLAAAAGTGNWLEGKRFSSGASESTVREWAEKLLETVVNAAPADKDD